MEEVISLKEFMEGGYFPCYKEVRYRDGEYDMVGSVDMMRALYKEGMEVYIRWETGKFYRHRLCHRVVAYKDDGTRMRGSDGNYLEQDKESYREYKLFIHRLFKKGCIFIKKSGL